jgi:molecular chaperone IbpA
MPVDVSGLMERAYYNNCLLLDKEDMTMTTFDFSPLYRSAVGFDNLASLLDNISSTERTASTYPPYNIELVKEDAYRITMAVAGFNDDDITVEVENNTLTVSSNREEADEETRRNYLHRGIAERNFKRQFKLAEHIKVTGASMVNGLLHIDLVREIPEAMKPRQIAINAKGNRLLKSA